jgi:phosphoglycolate phosphatase
MKDKQLVIFDMDGTLVNSSLTIANAINHVRKHLGYPPMNPEEILKKVNDPSIDPARTFYHARRFEPLHEKLFTDYYTNNHSKELVLYDGVDELLEALKERGKSVALATNAYRNSTMESLQHLGIERYFDAIACYDDVPHGKPEPDMLYKILDHAKHSREQAVFVGDGPRDQIAAQKAGMDYLMVDWGFSDHKDAIGSVDTLKKKLL